VRVGCTLPQFRHEAEPSLETAVQAEAVGLDGVFAFDHLWPLGQPERPALHGLTLAAAVLASTSRLTVGTLVARVGVLPDAVLANQLATLARMAGGRLVAGLGVGDAMSRPENLAVGVPFRPREERQASLVDVCRRLRARRITTWVGGNSDAVRAVARTEADALNLWGVEPAAVGEATAGGGAVTWAGQMEVGALGAAGVAECLKALARHGATWAVVAPVGTPWPEAVETIAAAAGSLVD
jgi:alkanesulfonate monooxygenase SsuD/methylene tetrahydromethanopterin reductase-like flavin-dependent oxidoreductase (luciferase family)